ncbi:protein of unknown function, DUF302-containing [Citrifermentans bemidjiense Bem]|uniref:DUF302 domain-containing protein n=1 Tax=Citrifermentans bemidjiense (strain ATCC BAA-1014 / DSM 16622 / JCM 12645 / Bem) TaxID=404380 RepID=B5EEC7_CITBB|nr:DUF302 domain-containing protein [Citrifermentans bemidjiense]ACH39272.1 protein of unknown function, DUF302-containing [Citrifermentans bemidjiense Bem]
MRKISYSCEVHAAFDTIWKLIIEKVEQPQTYLPGAVQSRILQHYGNGLLREVRGEGLLIKEKVVIDKTHGEVHYFLMEHPLFTGRVINRVVPSSVQSPVAPQILSIEVDWTPKDDEAERMIQATIPEQIQREVLSLKQLAEAMEKEESLPLHTPYAFGITMTLTFSDALEKVQQELQKEGFGIISYIDIKKKFQEKLHKDFRNYQILGACNPGLAYQAFGIEINIGTLLPCNVVVYSLSEGRTVVMVMDPVAALSLVGNSQLTELAETVKQSMQRVIAAL